MLRKRNYFIYNTAIFQIVLLILSSFAIAFIFSESFGARASAITTELPAATMAKPVGVSPVHPNIPGPWADGYIFPEDYFLPGDFVGPIYNPVPVAPVGGAASGIPTALMTTTTARFLPGAQLVGGGSATILAAPDATVGVAIQNGQAFTATWSQSASAWQASGTALTQQQLAQIPMANTFHPGMTVVDAQALGAGPVQTIGMANGQTAQAVVFANGQTAGLVNAEGTALTSPTTWNPAANAWNNAGPQVAPQAGILQSVFGGQAFGIGSAGAIWAGALFSGLVWGGIVGGAAYFLAGAFGLNDKQAASVGLGLGAGTFVGASLFLVGKNAAAAAAAGTPGVAVTPGSFGAFATSGFGAVLIGAGVAAAVIILTYKKEKKELIRFECQAWEPPTGGARCEECNNDPLMPCSEYRCRSLGQACEIVNAGTTEEMCFWKSKGDTSAPHMEPWQEALTDGYRYAPDRGISPPNRGFLIQDNAGKDTCLPAFSVLEFGVKTDEPAQCRVDYNAKTTYSEMEFLFGESALFLEEHTQRLKVPNTQEEGDVVPEIGVDGTFTLWVRCMDKNGNGEDSAAVAFSFCVDDGPDTTQPTIEGSSIESGRPVQYNVDSVPIEIYVNEPSECKWSRIDKAYSDMENVMDCGKESYQINADLNYVCSAQLTGIVNRVDNGFYFRCEDRAGNIMATSYPLLLKGTEELVIARTGPRGDFTGSTTTIPVMLEVETAHGADNGKATCSFSNTETGRFVIMDNTRNVYLHNQTLDLAAGYYIYHFRCIDAGGNLATNSTMFRVVTDTTDPLVTRVFKDGNALKVITSEEAKCYYSNTNCNYNVEDGIVMLYEDATKRDVHTAEWKKDVTYYIKCEDFQGNQPRPDACQIVAKASEL